MSDVTEVEHDLMSLVAQEEAKRMTKSEDQAAVEVTELADNVRRKKEREAEFTAVKDSGQRQEFSTGAVRDTQTGKGFPHLLPSHALLRLAKHFENGAKKYGKNNWRKG